MAERNQPGADQMTVISPEAEFQGRLTCRGPARILGAFEGEILSDHEVHIAEGAECHATIQAARIVVDGLIDGDLTASDRLQLGPKARVRGDLVAAALVVAEGASFCGHCTVGPEISSPQSALTSTTPTRNATPKSTADSLAIATAELENDPEWQSLSR